jgi:hypothetical protein
MLAVDSGTLTLPRLALHRETVLALTGGLVHAKGGNGKNNGPKAGTKGKHCAISLPTCWRCPTEYCY